MKTKNNKIVRLGKERMSLAKMGVLALSCLGISALLFILGGNSNLASAVTY